MLAYDAAPLHLARVTRETNEAVQYCSYFKLCGKPDKLAQREKKEKQNRCEKRVMARSNGSTNEGISVSPVYSTPKNHESRWCQQPCAVYQLNPDVFQLPVDSKRCILTRVE